MKMDTTYMYGANLIAEIQQQIPDSDDIVNNIAQAFEPVHAFSILFPFVAGLNAALATDILVVSASTEWLTMILKWVLREDRPFWWVRETGHAAPSLAQAASTCSTSFGSPSEHVALAAAVGCVLAAHASRTWRRPALAWPALALALALVALARMLPAASFPHQCVLGATIGVLVSRIALAQHLPAGRCMMLIVALALALIALAAYWIQRGAGVDPQASVKRAFKWCEQPETIHVSTTPLFSLARAVGSFVGLALSAPLCASRSARLPAVPALLTCAFLAWSLGLVAENVPTHSSATFFAAHFALAALRAPVFLRLLPLVVARCSRWLRPKAASPRPP